MSRFLDYDPDDIDVRVAELLTATHDGADPLVHPKVCEALGMMRQHLGMDVIFVSQIKDHKRTFRVVDSDPRVTKVVAGHSDPVEESFCHYIVDGRAPQFMKDAEPFIESGVLPRPGIRIGTHLSTPIRLRNGAVYGTLCCFSEEVKDDVSSRDLRRLEAAAKIIADDLNRTGIGAELELSPVTAPGRLMRGPR